MSTCLPGRCLCERLRSHHHAQAGRGRQGFVRVRQLFTPPQPPPRPSSAPAHTRLARRPPQAIQRNPPRPSSCAALEAPRPPRRTPPVGCGRHGEHLHAGAVPLRGRCARGERWRPRRGLVRGSSLASKAWARQGFVGGSSVAVVWARQGFVRGSSVACEAWARQGFVSGVRSVGSSGVRQGFVSGVRSVGSSGFVRGSHLCAGLDIAPAVDVQRELLGTPGQECAQPRRELGGERESNHLQRNRKQLLQTCQIRGQGAHVRSGLTQRHAVAIIGHRWSSVALVGDQRPSARTFQEGRPQRNQRPSARTFREGRPQRP